MNQTKQDISYGVSEVSEVLNSPVPSCPLITQISLDEAVLRENSYILVLERGSLLFVIKLAPFKNIFRLLSFIEMCTPKTPVPYSSVLTKPTLLDYLNDIVEIDYQKYLLQENMPENTFLNKLEDYKYFSKKETLDVYDTFENLSVSELKTITTNNNMKTTPIFFIISRPFFNIVFNNMHENMCYDGEQDPVFILSYADKTKFMLDLHVLSSLFLDKDLEKIKKFRIQMSALRHVLPI
ncbi:hypothetical protein DLEV_070 [Diachasmimorpha longicaudata entomopoxvirus]|uniref:Uncharacterized protein n=1 Tax=Diachasmimorpha longicaudata entomopoxvirus TaxID=109981 RepID=A0A7R5WK11_9POXV|nr:hypothetical protein QKK69_gp070 [Diachasmimorpha longicaudata entomopoxvirus]AKS26361.1 hypothetical protein DLEV_070 [Diachasmimorpha longicaudata entomopoxvirus]